MNKLKQIFNIKFLTTAVLVYIMLQPALDILSFLDIREMIPFGISTYLKPLFVFGLGIIIYILSKAQRKKWTIAFAFFAVLIVIHSIILYILNVETGTIFHEIRFTINIAYMLVLFMIFDYLYNENTDKINFLKNLKKALVITFITYCATVALAVITGTSGLTYEYSDALKLGFKGWLDSGQIFGHALSIMLPVIIFYMFNCNLGSKSKNIIIRLLVILLVVVLYMIGTKVTYFICAIVLASHVVLDFIFWLRDRKNKNLLISSIACLAIVTVFIGTYKLSPVYYNTEINNSVLSAASSQEVIDKDTKREDIKKLEEYITGMPTEESLLSRIKKNLTSNYYMADVKATQVLQDSFTNGSLHASDNRNKQLVYNFNKYMEANAVYKIFGLGYLNQPGQLSIERDILMVTFGLGLIGVFTVLIYPIKQFCSAGYNILRRLKKVKLETLYLFEGFGIFFCISFYAGYTFIYTNFSIFLVALMFLLKANIDKQKEEEFSEKVMVEGKEKILGFNVCNTDKQTLLKNIFTDFDNGEKMFIVNVNPEIATHNYKNEEFVEKFNKQKYQIPDGTGIAVASKMKHGNIKHRITGIDLMEAICAEAPKHDARIFLYGSKPGIAEAAKVELEKTYKGINIVGVCNGYGTQEEAIEKIKQSNANIVFVALGSPKQEDFILKNMDTTLNNVKIFMPVGGSLDVISKTLKRAPEWVINLNLEWLYRLLKQPKRIFRQLNLVKFVFLVKFKDRS